RGRLPARDARHRRADRDRRRAVGDRDRQPAPLGAVRDLPGRCGRRRQPGRRARRARPGGGDPMTDPSVAAATLHAYVRASGALGASALIDEGMVEVVADEPLADDAAPLSLDLAVRKLPPFAVNAATGEVSAPLGALEHLADGVRALAGAFGDRSVALV